MNAGAYGGEMSQILVSCRALLPDGTIREFGREEMKLGYRRSVFAENGGIILSCTMRLAEGRQDQSLNRRIFHMKNRMTIQRAYYEQLADILYPDA